MKKIRKITAMLSAAVMAVSLASISVNSNAEGDVVLPDDSIEGYIDTTKDYHYERYTFEQLLAMSDDEFIALDTYFGDIPEEDQGMFTMYRCIYRILTGSGNIINYNYYDGDFPYTEEISWDIGTEKKYYVYNGTTDEELDLLYEQVNALNSAGSVFDKENEPLCAIIPIDSHNKRSEEEKSGFYLGVSTLRPAFFLDNYNEEYKEFDRDAFEADMNEVFGGAVGYKMNEYSGQDNEQKSLLVTFDAEECSEINQENVLYFAKLYYGLTSISPYFSYSREYILGSEGDEPAFTNTTTSTTITTTTATTTTSAETTTADESTGSSEITETPSGSVTSSTARTTASSGNNGSPKTGDSGMAGVILAGISAVAMAFALRKREE